MKKKGQFYLIVGIIFIILVMDFVNISNYLKKVNYQEYKDLKEELRIESEKVLDYALYKGLSENEKKELIVNFTNLYKEKEGKQNLYFIFGNPNKTGQITFVGHQELTQEDVYVNEQLVISDGNPYDINSENNATVKIISDNEYSYPFDLKKGDNFHFIIIEQIGGNRYIVVE